MGRKTGPTAKVAKRLFKLRYTATVRGILEVEAVDEAEARSIADSMGYDGATAEQTDFEIESCRDTGETL